MLWEVDIYPADGFPDRSALAIGSEASGLGLSDRLALATARGYLVEGAGLDRPQVERLARELLADTIVEKTLVAKVGDRVLNEAPAGKPQLVYVLPKAGVMDPVADSALAAIRALGIDAGAVRTLKKYWIGALDPDDLKRLAAKILANEAIEQIHFGPLPFDRLVLGGRYTFERREVPLGELAAAELAALSFDGQLHLQLPEMKTIQAHFGQLGRNPTDIELETIAQTWSEHCSHKTLAGRIQYQDENGPRRFENMLKETVFAATETIRARLGERDWCVSVFQDNAGIVRLDDEHNVVFKVETHNHPSALEPYGGANTGIGGVIRDTMGTGLGAKPIASTDVFCFAPLDLPAAGLPPGVLHPRRVLKGVVAGVRDYGNRMGIPTVSGAIFFDDRYLGNPLVYCGSVGLIPRAKSFKETQPGTWIVAVGGRTGRDGIHGATFSSAELTSQSEELSGGAVQIGNAITEKMVLDVLLEARDRGLFSAITDCGAGGFSSAVGEMGEAVGAEVWLDRVPLKYAGLSYTEIWISEAQERMVLAVPPEQWDELAALCAAEGVEATVIGKYVPTGRLILKYDGVQVADLSMDFLHHGRPPVVRRAVYEPPPELPLALAPAARYTEDLLRILGSPNVASKEWVIRQYDHEVQGGSVVKPLVGRDRDGPSDAAVVRPVPGSERGVVIACGMNPRYGDLDTYHMAASAIDEAVRNCVAVGADPDRIAILDNFCWGNCERPEMLGGLVRAALACHDVAVAFGTPFISGKDSLNNEFSYEDSTGRKQTVAVPPSLLISAMGQMEDVRRAVTADLKEPGNLLYLVGITRDELGGSHLALVRRAQGGRVPRVDPPTAKRNFRALHRAVQAGLIRACHDLSEGGLAVAAAEMALAGGLGARLALAAVPHDLPAVWPAGAGRGPSDPPGPPSAGNATPSLLFSESNSRFLCEVPAASAEAFEQLMDGVVNRRVGEVTGESRLIITGVGAADAQGQPARGSQPAAVDVELAVLKEAWQAPLQDP